jgi:hypothetical protein
MSIQMQLAPVFVLVLLTFLLLFGMGRARLGALSRREVQVGDISLGQKAWPEPATRISNTFSNQFELPVLFYALVALALPLRRMDLIMVLLAWVFVVTRYAHAAVYVTSNSLQQRFSAFVAGAIVLLVMWIYFFVRVFFPIL